jgi:peptidoglycan/LPS O-acetylase OafA/YrhL
MREGGSIFGFLRRRLIRIYPPLWFSIVAAFAISLLITLGVAGKNGRWIATTVPGADMTWADWVEVVTLTRGFFFPVDPYHCVNSVYWSLAIEVQFYLVVACALAIPKKFYGLLAAVTLAALPFTRFPGAAPAGFFLPFWTQFALGIGLYFLLDRGITPQRLLGRWASGGSTAALCLLVPAFLLVPRVDEFMPKTCAAFLVALALWFGFHFDAAVNALRVSQNAVCRTAMGMFVLLGAMSYSLYLLHLNLLELPRLALKQLAPEPSIVADFTGITLTCALCYPFYRFCELPFVGTPRSMARNGEAPAG